MADDVRAKCEQIVTQCFQKIAQVILQARFSMTQEAGDERVNKWFNTAMRDLPSITALVSPWRLNLDNPLLVDVYFDSNNRKLTGGTNKAADLQLLEHWEIVYEKRFGLRVKKKPKQTANVFSLVLPVIPTCNRQQCIKCQ